jgi:hypothetical protein
MAGFHQEPFLARGGLWQPQADHQAQKPKADPALFHSSCLKNLNMPEAGRKTLNARYQRRSIMHLGELSYGNSY